MKFFWKRKEEKPEQRAELQINPNPPQPDRETFVYAEGEVTETTGARVKGALGTLKNIGYRLLTGHRRREPRPAVAYTASTKYEPLVPDEHAPTRETQIMGWPATKVERAITQRGIEESLALSKDGIIEVNGKATERIVHGTQEPGLFKRIFGERKPPKRAETPVSAVMETPPAEEIPTVTEAVAAPPESGNDIAVEIVQEAIRRSPDATPDEPANFVDGEGATVIARAPVLAEEKPEEINIEPESKQLVVVTPVPAPQPETRLQKLRGGLKHFFDAAAGVATSSAATTLVVKFGVSSTVQLLGIGAATGAVTSLGMIGYDAAKEYRKLRLQKDFTEASTRAVLRHIWNKNKRQYYNKVGFGILGGLVGGAVVSLISDHWEDIKDFTGLLGGAAAPALDDTEVLQPASPVVEPAAVEPAPQPVTQADPAPASAAEPAVEAVAETVSEILTPQQQLEALATRTDLSERARGILDAALRGEAWALDSAGVGILNAGTGISSVDYGFPVIPEMKEAAAQWIKQSAEAGFEQGQRNYAYLQYNNLYGIAEDKDAALDAIRQHGPYKGAENLAADFNTAAVPADGDVAVVCETADNVQVSCTATGADIKAGNVLEVRTAAQNVYNIRLDGRVDVADQGEKISAVGSIIKGFLQGRGADFAPAQ